MAPALLVTAVEAGAPYSHLARPVAEVACSAARVWRQEAALLSELQTAPKSPEADLTCIQDAAQAVVVRTHLRRVLYSQALNVPGERNP